MPSARPLRTTGLWLLLGGLVLFTGLAWDAYVRQAPIIEEVKRTVEEQNQNRSAWKKESDSDAMRRLFARGDYLRAEENRLLARLNVERDRAQYAFTLTAPLWIGCPMIGLGLIGWDAWRRRGQRRGGIKA